jgi:ATP-dependent Clp protease protease subunit
MTPDVGDWGQFLRGQMFDRRVVLVSGRLDDESGNRAAIEMMTLDATGDDPVTLQIDSGDGTVTAALALMDVIDLLGVPVHGVCVGQAGGPAVGVLAVCHRRTIAPSARLRLNEPPVEAAGNARQLQQWVAAHHDRWSAFCRRVATATNRPEEEVRADFEAGPFLTADEAVTYGLADEVARPDARILPFPSRMMGFGSR